MDNIVYFHGAKVSLAPFFVIFYAWEQRELGECMETVTDYVAAGSFADIAENVQYKTFPDFAQLIRTVDLKHEFKNNDYIYVDKKAFDYLWKVNLRQHRAINKVLSSKA